ncbi:hypothetical protein [Pseudophaeobacter sp.]|uniref:hypothetical protein n=1 Tax=unclassified Pseudophaeobacter TaxID=2637024 RepID=UPI0026184D1D|nr:hypothetical protein [Pseudophaeobacter sp.]
MRDAEPVKKLRPQNSFINSRSNLLSGGQEIWLKIGHTHLTHYKKATHKSGAQKQYQPPPSGPAH